MRASSALRYGFFSSSTPSPGRTLGIEGAEGVARGVEHPQRPAQFGELQCELPAVHGAGHDDVGEEQIERHARLHHFERLGRGRMRR